LADKEIALIAYGLDIFEKATGRELSRLKSNLLGVPPEVRWETYTAALGAQQPAEEFLRSLFALVRMDSPGKQTGELQSVYIAAQPLALSEVGDSSGSPLFPMELQAARLKTDFTALAQGFEGEARAASRLPGLDSALLFEAYYHLFRKYAWGLPCTYGEPGVSLFEQWKTTCALAMASGEGWKASPSSTFSLVGGDIPSIQEFVFTITSKGAAKGLRGRSFFVQLLGDAVMRRILMGLKLNCSSVVYSAGGNFMLLAPALQAEWEGKTIAEQLAGINQELEGRLLAELHGELTACLAWVDLPLEQVGSHAFADSASRQLKEAIAARKRQRYLSVAETQWANLFEPQGKPGNRYCVICQQPLGMGEGIELEGQGDIPADERERRCSNCDGFQQLATSISDAELWSINERRPAQAGEHWQVLLWNTCQLWYTVGTKRGLPGVPGEFRYTVNSTAFTDAQAHGFRFIANATPRVTASDIALWEQDGDHESGEPQPKLGGIRTFSQMADAAVGVHRLGVLRMDVDDLGQIMVRGLRPRSLAATSALSAALDQFFAGYLNIICKEVNQISDPERQPDEPGERLYVIYAGGDDLFVTGAWDLMPLLAEKVHEEFTRYTCRNPGLHISGGISLEERKFPLYQAAERAGRAEEAAKSHARHGVSKDAFCFLGLPVKWDEWTSVRQYQREILSFVQPDQAPKALIRVLQDIYLQYLEQIKIENQRRLAAGLPLPDEIEYQLYYGPWMWRSGYYLTRMSDRVKEKDAKAIVLRLQRASIDKNHVRLIGLASRWAELLSRKEE
jgi:CRISPR-associated protein Csm1